MTYMQQLAVAISHGSSHITKCGENLVCNMLDSPLFELLAGLSAT